uniref:GIY-YIG domain-containing protein n=1 Tax=viral metagenome TaxID=1070528 RepID=A0A6C0LJ54_9ZZZZ
MKKINLKEEERKIKHNKLLIYKMPKGYVYKLESNIKDDNRYYYGCTSQTIEKMMYNNKHHPVSGCIEWFKEIGFKNIRCTIIEEHNDISKRDLCDKKDIYIKKYISRPDCMSSCTSRKLTEEEKQQEKLRIKREKRKIEQKYVYLVIQMRKDYEFMETEMKRVYDGTEQAKRQIEIDEERELEEAYKLLKITIRR